MSYAHNRRLFASTSFRLSLAYSIVIAVAFALAGVGVWLVTTSDAQRASRERLEAGMVYVQRELREEGLDSAIAALDLKERYERGFDYRLVAADGRRIAGKLDLDAPHAGWSSIYLPKSSDGAPSPDLIFLREPTADGGYLTIAEDLESTEGDRYAVLRTLLWFGAAALVFSLAAGFFVTRRTLRRMDGVISAMESVGGGNLSARIAVRDTSGNDDIDILGQHINDMLSRISALVENLRRVSTDIAHDLRTPLTHILHDLDALAANPPRLAELTQSAEAKVQGLLRTFDAIMRLAEIEAGAARSRFTSIDLEPIVERVADAYRPDVENAGGRLEVQCHPSPAIHGDPDLVTQAIANLIENAIRHAGPKPEITLTLAASGDRLILTVEDRGPGIPPEFRAAVLEPHFRLDRSRTTPGAGLGLSIVAAISRLHHASLTLEDAHPGLRVKLGWPQERLGSQ